MADNYIKDVLKDVLRHTHDLGIFEMVKVKGSSEETGVETVDADKTVILKGVLNNPVVDFIDATVGLSSMGVLNILDLMMRTQQFKLKHKTEMVRLFLLK